MRSSTWSKFLAMAATLWVTACGQGDWVPVPGSDDAVKSSGAVRAARRLYDGAPPVIPHAAFGAACGACHDTKGISVEGVGYAPASPHDDTGEAGATVRCRQCHVAVLTDGLFAKNMFEGLPQDLRRGSRLYDGAPPTIPHRILMREKCAACHVGAGARAEIVTTHPERTRCRQCHVPVTTREGILSYGAVGLATQEGS
ncbi:MAG: nitrate reductase cytochrome c-type subunit [Longimicrobiales bacterium]|nr:nitrate reductase cytochrome c-type subunit [Longimicrobiales bacterium]